MGFVLFLLALTGSSMTGWNMYWLILVAGLVTMLYTLIGGLEAVIWTDVIQGFVMWLGIIVILGFLVLPDARRSGGGVRTGLGERSKFSLGSPQLDFADKTSFWVMSLYGFFWYLQKYSADQTIVQRYLVAKSDRDALKGVALGALLCVPVWTLFMLIGTLVWSYYQLSGEAFPPDMMDKTGKVISDQVFPHFLVTKIPAGLAGLFIAALFAAGMSTLSSDLNCLSAVGVEDYYRKLRPNASDQRRLFIGKLIVGICGLLAVGIAALIAWKSDRVLSLYYAVSSIISGGLAGLFLLAFCSRRANKQGLWIGIIVNLIFTAWATLTSGKNMMFDLTKIVQRIAQFFGGSADGQPPDVGNWNFPWAGVMIGVIGHVIVLGVGYAASWCFPPDEHTKEEWTIWGWLARRKSLPRPAAPEPAAPKT